jgi:Tfp pilus assembly ATPase PilU
MQTFDQALAELVRAGLVAEEDARAVATNPHDLGLALGGGMAYPITAGTRGA